MLRVSAGAAALCGLVLLAACGTGLTTAANPTTQTFTGTLQQNGSVYNNFTVTTEGTATITLTSLLPQSTITVGLAIGQPTSGGCSLFSSNESSRVGTQISGDLTAGSYCAGLYDIGNLNGPQVYVITVSHT